MTEIGKPISIHHRGITIFLEEGEYIVSVLGGFGVEMNSFQMEIVAAKDESVIYCQRLRWKYQYYVKGKKAKKFLKFSVTKSGDYRLRFIDSDTLELRSSNLPVFSWFQKTIPNEGIEILIHYNWNK